MLKFPFVRNATAELNTDAFKIPSTFNKDFVVSREDIGEFLDYFGFSVKSNALLLHEYVYSLFMDKVGCTNDTPTNEVMAVSYLLLRTNSFGFDEYVDRFNNFLHLNSTLTIASKHNIEVPSSYLDTCASMIGSLPMVQNILLRHETLKVNNEAKNQSFTAPFVHKIVAKTEMYVEGMSDLSTFLKDLDINSNQIN